jgi:hypothetical protein
MRAEPRKAAQIKGKPAPGVYWIWRGVWPLLAAGRRLLLLDPALCPGFLDAEAASGLA